MTVSQYLMNFESVYQISNILDTPPNIVIFILIDRILKRITDIEILLAVKKLINKAIRWSDEIPSFLVMDCVMALIELLSLSIIFVSIPEIFQHFEKDKDLSCLQKW